MKKPLSAEKIQAKKLRRDKRKKIMTARVQSKVNGLSKHIEGLNDQINGLQKSLTESHEKVVTLTKENAELVKTTGTEKSDS